MNDYDLKENGYTYHGDSSHAGSLSCDKEILEAKGVIEDWEAPDEGTFYVLNPEWDDEEFKAEWKEDHDEELAQFMNTYTAYISHCFTVTTPDGTTLSYGDETPHGKIGSEEFTLWWNGLNSDTLTYADVDSWCDG